VLVVGPLPEAASTASVFPPDTFRVRTVETFAEAKGFLEAERPRVLVTALRLREYNGLHLVLRAKTIQPDMVAIVLSPAADAVLQEDAEAMGAIFAVEPIARTGLLAAVLRALHADGPTVIRPPFERRERDRRTTQVAVTSDRRMADRRRRHG
jgi:DNA-binding NtrC family response regulator